MLSEYVTSPSASRLRSCTYSQSYATPLFPSNYQAIQELDADDQASSSAPSTQVPSGATQPTAIPHDAAARLRMLQNEKAKGNDCFRAGEYTAALQHYSGAIDAADGIEATAKAVLYCNRAMANIKLERWMSARNDATQAIALDASNTKAWVRRAQAHLKLSDPALALADLRQAQALSPDSGMVDKLMKQAQAKLATCEVEGTAAPGTALASSNFKRVAIADSDEDSEADSDEDDTSETLAERLARQLAASGTPEGGDLLSALPQTATQFKRVAVQEDSDSDESDSEPAASSAPKIEAMPELTPEQLSDAAKQQGAQAFAAQDFEVAASHFLRALPGASDPCAIRANLAAVYLKLEQWSAAASQCHAALQALSWSKDGPVPARAGLVVKLLFRRGAALEGCGQLLDAAAAYADALVLEPGNARAQGALQAVQLKLAQADSAEDAVPAPAPAPAPAPDRSSPPRAAKPAAEASPLASPTPAAPTSAQQLDTGLREVLAYDEARVAYLRGLKPKAIAKFRSQIDVSTLDVLVPALAADLAPAKPTLACKILRAIAKTPDFSMAHMMVSAQTTAAAKAIVAAAAKKPDNGDLTAAVATAWRC